MIMIGFASVMIWHWFDDLRFYVWVQFMPMLVIPVMLLLYSKRYSHSYLLIWALLIYVLAKALEVFDTEIFSLLTVIIIEFKNLSTALHRARSPWINWATP